MIKYEYLTDPPSNVQSNQQYFISNSFLVNVGGFLFQSLTNTFLFTKYCVFHKCRNTNGGGILFECSNSNTNISYCCFVANSLTNTDAYGQAVAIRKQSSTDISYVIGVTTSEHVSSVTRARDTYNIGAGPVHLKEINNSQNDLMLRSFLYLFDQSNTQNVIEFAHVSKNYDNQENFISFENCRSFSMRFVNFLDNIATTLIAGSNTPTTIINCLFYNNSLDKFMTGSISFVDCLFDKFYGTLGIDSFEAHSSFSNIDPTIFGTYLCQTGIRKKEATCQIKSRNYNLFHIIWTLFVLYDN